MHIPSSLPIGQIHAFPAISDIDSDAPVNSKQQTTRKRTKAATTRRSKRRVFRDSVSPEIETVTTTRTHKLSDDEDDEFMADILGREIGSPPRDITSTSAVTTTTTRVATGSDIAPPAHKTVSPPERVRVASRLPSDVSDLFFNSTDTTTTHSIHSTRAVIKRASTKATRTMEAPRQPVDSDSFQTQEAPDDIMDAFFSSSKRQPKKQTTQQKATTAPAIESESSTADVLDVFFTDTRSRRPRPTVSTTTSKDNDKLTVRPKSTTTKPMNVTRPASPPPLTHRPKRVKAVDDDTDIFDAVMGNNSTRTNSTNGVKSSVVSAPVATTTHTSVLTSEPPRKPKPKMSVMVDLFGK